MQSQPLLRTLRLISTSLIIILAVYGLYTLFFRRNHLGAENTKIEATALSPISRGEILSQMRLVTVERQYRIPVIGRSYKPLPTAENNGIIGQVVQDFFGNRDSVPGTTTELVYEMVTTVTMGIDLGKLRDEDIENSDSVTTLTLPGPEVMSVIYDSAESKIFAKNSPTLPYLDNSAALLEQLQRTGVVKHRLEAENDEALAANAENEARRALQSLLEKIHPGREVKIEFHRERKDLPPE